MPLRVSTKSTMLILCENEKKASEKWYRMIENDGDEVFYDHKDTFYTVSTSNFIYIFAHKFHMLLLVNFVDLVINEDEFFIFVEKRLR